MERRFTLSNNQLCKRKNVISRETDANGQVTTYSVKGIVSRDTNEKSIAPYAIRIINYSISLVGKR